MPSTRKKARQDQPLSICSNAMLVSSNMTDDRFPTLNIAHLENSIRENVDDNILPNLLSNAKDLSEIIYNNKLFSKDNFNEIENNYMNLQTNEIINECIKLTENYLEKFLISSTMIRCYIHIHEPSSQSGNNQGVNIQNQILKELEEMEVIIKNNENLFIDYYKKHYEILKYLNKYPSIEDYHLYLIDHEKKIFDDLRAIILELRTMFLKTYDIVIKNLTKIQMPRSRQNISMIN